MSTVNDDGGIGVLAELIKQVNASQVDVNNFITAFNAHTHAVAMTNAIVVGQRPAAATATTVVLQK